MQVTGTVSYVLQYKPLMMGQFSELQLAIRIPVFLVFSREFPALYSLQLAACTDLSQPEGALKAPESHRCSQMASALRHLPGGSTGSFLVLSAASPSAALKLRGVRRGRLP